MIWKNATDAGCAQRTAPWPSSPIENKKAVIGRGCVECRTCFKVCPKQAVMEVITPAPGAVVCGSCPVGCQVPEGGRGACHRYVNQNGTLVRTRPLLTYEDVAPSLAPSPEPAISKPIVTAIGAGGTYPDYVPAPYIVTDRRDGVDVVTVVTEAPPVLFRGQGQDRHGSGPWAGKVRRSSSKAARWAWWKPRNTVQRYWPSAG